MKTYSLRFLLIGFFVTALAFISSQATLADDPPTPADPPGVTFSDKKLEGDGARISKAKKKEIQSAPKDELAPEAVNVAVGANSAWTTDGVGNFKTTFLPYDSIRYYGQIYNNSGSGRQFYAWFYRSTPCGSGYLWQGWLYGNTGTPAWYYSTSAQCVGTHTFTFWVYYQGTYTSRSRSYTVYGYPTQFGAPQTTWSKLSSCLYGLTTCYKRGWYHTGIDSYGSSDVLATGPGIIRFAQSGFNNNLGNTVIIEHTLTTGSKIYSQYSHLQSITTSQGACVSKGDKIGVKGNSPGGWEEHLHLEFKISVTLGSSPSGYWGYVPTHPDNWGYRNPSNYIYSKYAYGCK